MAKIRPILTLLLTLALMLQSYGELSAHEGSCCPDDCSMEAAFCPMLTTGGICAACQTAVISPHALNAAAIFGEFAAQHSNAINIYSAYVNRIWRPPIAASNT